MATHNVDILKNLSKRVITLEKGKLVRDDASTDSASFDKTQDKSSLQAGSGQVKKGEHKK